MALCNREILPANHADSFKSLAQENTFLNKTFIADKHIVKCSKAANIHKTFKFNATCPTLCQLSPVVSLYQDSLFIISCLFSLGSE